VPLHLQPAYRHLGIAPGTLPETEKSAARCLSLPLYPELTEEQVETVVGQLKEALKS
jgi:dTDP-4-amino-4,6-dideoxygalactose transaminase